MAGNLQRINNLVEVRNCIVHAGGWTDKYRYPSKVEKAIAQLKERDKDRNMKLIDITDKFLCLGENIICTAIESSEDIIGHCSSFTLCATH